MANERTIPRVGANALAEYLTAAPLRRRRIVEQQKRPRDFQVIFYQPASEALLRFLIGGRSDPEVIIKEIERLYSEPAKSDYDATRNEANAEALQSFLEFHDELDIGELTPVRTPKNVGKLDISGVQVSVYPELTLNGSLPRHGNVTGAIKFFFSKNESLHLTPETGGYPSALVYQLMATSTSDEPAAKVLPRYCITLDVFGRGIHSAPSSHRRLLADIGAACEEFAMHWAVV